jgi:ABC-2 type transport system permease protein
MMSEVLAVFVKELKVILREKRLLAILIMQPIILITVFGYAFSGEIKNVPAAVIDDDGSFASKQIISAIISTEVLDIKYFAATASEAVDMIKRGDIQVAIYIPEGFYREIKNGRGEIRVFVDESNFNVAITSINLIERIASSFSRELKGGIAVEQRYIFTTKTRMIDFIAPAIIGVVIQMLGLILSASSIAREREEGTLELILATPLRSADLIAGKFLAITCIIVLDIFNVMLIAHYLFNVEVRGSILLLFAVQLLFLTGSIGLGLAISAVSATQLQGIQASMLMAIVSIFLSGFFYPLESMPEAARLIAYFIPLTYANLAFRNVMVKGNGLDVVFPYVAVLVFYTLLTTLLAIRLLRRKIGTGGVS